MGTVNVETSNAAAPAAAPGANGTASETPAEEARRVLAMDKEPGRYGRRKGLPYQLHTWYQRRDGLAFMLFEPARPVGNRPGHWVGEVLLRDRRVVTLEWGEKTTKMPSVRRRMLRRFAPWLAPTLERVVDAVREELW